MSVFDKYHGDTPGRDTCAAIARAFSDSPVRNPERRDRRACERRRDRSRVSPLSVSPSSSLLSPSALYQTPTPATPATPATPTPTPVSSFTTSPIATPRGDDFFLSQRRARREDRAAEEKRRRRHSHDHPNAHLPGAISDAALLDADAPMFPSLMWNKLETEVDLTDLSDDDDDDDGGGGGGGGWGEFSGGSGSRIARGSSEWEDEWFVGAGDVALGLNEDEIEKLLASAPTPAEQDHERERDDGGADVKRSLSLPSMPLLLTPPAAVVAAKRAARADLEEWQPAGTSLYIGMIAHAGAPSHTRRQSSPSPPPPPPAEAPEIPYLPEPGKLLASEDHAAASIPAADRSGDVVAAVEVESTDDWVAAAVRVEPAKERIKTKPGGATAAATRSTTTSDSSDGDSDVDPFWTSQFQIDDLELASALALGGVDGRWVPLDVLRAMTTTTTTRPFAVEDDERQRENDRNESLASAVEELGDGEAHPVTWKQIKTWFENRRMTQKRMREGTRPVRRNNANAASAGSPTEPAAPAGPGAPGGEPATAAAAAAAPAKTRSHKKKPPAANASAGTADASAATRTPLAADVAKHGVKRSASRRKLPASRRAPATANETETESAAAAAAGEAEHSELTRAMSWADIR